MRATMMLALAGLTWATPVLSQTYEDEPPTPAVLINGFVESETPDDRLCIVREDDGVYLVPIAEMANEHTSDWLEAHCLSPYDREFVSRVMEATEQFDTVQI